ncbi:hypothetical protein, partial [Peribacillus simplex]|uniref:hypothetical protein n=1 Tax=Peribacillus simplex TaxID=1478 RepID=UPI001A91C43D
MIHHKQVNAHNIKILHYVIFLRRLLKTFIKILPSSVLKNLTPTNFKGVHISLIWYKGIKDYPFFYKLLIELFLLKVTGIY